MAIVHGCPPSVIRRSLLLRPVLGTNNGAPRCHVHTLYVCFPRSPQGFPLQAFLPMTFTTNVVVPAKWQLSFRMLKSFVLLTKQQRNSSSNLMLLGVHTHRPRQLAESTWMTSVQQATGGLPCFGHLPTGFQTQLSHCHVKWQLQTSAVEYCHPMHTYTLDNFNQTDSLKSSVYS